MLFRRALCQRYNRINETVRGFIEDSREPKELKVIAYLQVRLREIEADISTKRKSTLCIDHHLDELEAIIMGLHENHAPNPQFFPGTNLEVRFSETARN
jgi:hypothetical protein